MDIVRVVRFPVSRSELLLRLDQIIGRGVQRRNSITTRGVSFDLSSNATARRLWVFPIEPAIFAVGSNRRRRDHHPASPRTSIQARFRWLFRINVSGKIKIVMLRTRGAFGHNVSGTRRAQPPTLAGRRDLNIVPFLGIGFEDPNPFSLRSEYRHRRAAIS